MGQSGSSLQEISDYYGVSRERIRQIYRKFGVDPRDVGVKLRAKKSKEAHAAKMYLRRGDTTQDLYDVKKIKYRGKKGNAATRRIPFTINFSEIEWPTHCPVLGIELDYMAERRQENSVSFDRDDPSVGYVKGNVTIMSWRANRIKNDGTAEEHQLISEYMKKVVDKS